MVNLLHNAKDAVLESSKQDKMITIKTSLDNKNKIIIEISDNGIGVLAKNKDKIFNYGFTTKKSGHGFGLHTSAVTINEMGGAIAVKSEGLEKGTTFTLEIPYHTNSLIPLLDLSNKSCTSLSNYVTSGQLQPGWWRFAN